MLIPPLYLLASPDTPGAALDEALNLAAAGETISPKKASQIIEKHTSIAKEAVALGKSRKRALSGAGGEEKLS